MLEDCHIDTRITDKLKAEIERFVLSSNLSDPLPGLLWGKEQSEKKEGLLLGCYEKSQLPVNDPVRIVHADGLEFLVVQEELIDRMKGKTLDLVEGRIEIVD